ncbi:DUF1203 domain-containing protein [Jannaschia formosa]|uniref:DUF1203 domain-containing protein n=1 Tax=Jannaschia formosa TaxID=2259592 RepID=UPI000E1BDD1A|nr:DUF1203 domain-containing protein [Jannaschia formosa]TFL19751.1 DUF1203 domain-containing protein [Jannaschia formosa]
MRFLPFDPDFVASVRAGGPDANGRPAERAVSDGGGAPCRACLDDIGKGAAMLILAARPFPDLQPYAELGPIFLHADDCPAWDGEGLPPVLGTSPDYLVKSYGADHRIRYGTGAVVATGNLAQAVADRLGDAATAFVDIRSARNNCFLTRAVR